MPTPSADRSYKEQRRRLQRQKLIPTALLVVMAGFFILSHQTLLPLGPWKEWIRAASEAAVVGGLADWFAVTSLFRHPLGLPIPHTALIPRNQKIIAKRLAAFVTENFLTPELMQARLTKLQLPRQIGLWLSAPENATTTSQRLCTILSLVLRAMDDKRFHGKFQSFITALLRGIDPSPFLIRAISSLPAQDYNALVSWLAKTLQNVLQNRKNDIFNQVSEHSSWWVPTSVDKHIATAIIAGVDDILNSLSQPDHPTRIRFDAELQGLLLRLRDDPILRSSIVDTKNRVLRQPVIQSLWLELWNTLKESTLHSRLQSSVARGLCEFGNRLQSDTTLQNTLDERIITTVHGLMPWRQEIGAFIEEAVNQWESKTIVERLEFAVGRDLQYIRINGTVVGAVVGCVLHALSLLKPF